MMDGQMYADDFKAGDLPWSDDRLIILTAVKHEEGAERTASPHAFPDA